MAEKLGEIGNVLGGLGEATKTLNSFQQNCKELFQITEEVTKQAEEVEKIDLPGDTKLDELKQVLRNVLDSGSKLEVWSRNFGRGTVEFDKYLRANIKGSSIPQEVIAQFCNKLQRMHSMAVSFSDAFTTFLYNLGKAQLVATELADQQKKKAEDMEKEAKSKRNWGAAGSAGLIVGGVGLAALGFFTFGASLPAAASAFAGAAAVGAGGVTAACLTANSVNKMRELASDILSGAQKLGVLADRMKSSSDKVGNIKLDDKAVEALKTALEFLKRDLEKDELIAQQQTDIEDRDEKIAALEEKLRRMTR